nr:HlyD family efflux transporter periplasmic adaptor subunit [uncultured Blautia sp.]
MAAATEVIKVQTAEVKKGNISNTITGTGNLELDDAEAVSIPSGLTIGDVLVESGDYVSAGTVLANVDSASVQTAMDEIQSELEELDEKIRTCQEDEDANAVVSSVSGRVKAIYVEEGSDVADIIIEKGALIELSLDGYMAVSIEKTDSVAAGGTVSSVSVTENESVSADDELLVLEGTESSAEYEKLLLVRKARTETLQKFAQLARSPQIIAEQDGIVQDVNVAASGTTSSESSAQSSTTSGAGNASQMAYTGQDLSDLTFTQLSFDDGTTPVIVEKTENNSDDTQDTVQDQQIAFSIVGSGNSTGSLAVIPAPVTGQTPVTDISASDGIYSGVITWNPADSVFAAGTEYKALVVLSAAEGYCFTTASIQGIETGTVSGVQISDNGKTLEFQMVFPETAAENNNSGGQIGDNGNSGQESDSTVTDGSTSQSSSNEQQSNEQQDTTGSTQNNENSSTTQNSAAAGNSNSQSVQAGQSTGSTGASASGTASTADSTSTSKEDSTEDAVDSASQYSTDVTAFMISPDENRLLSVSVDELDINSVELGQKAVVTFDAIEDQEFEGEVTKIGNTASVSGGVAKYTITIPEDDKMKQGMNASATITIEDREDVLTLPMNALQEKGDRTFVYTEKDDDGNLFGETEVTTGLSDGSTVEITDGLEEGTTVYYLRSESSSSGSSTDMPDMQMPDMSGGGMDGGGMPQMDGNGGGDMSGGPGGGGGQGGSGK